MNAPRDPWDQGGSGQQPGQPGPRYYPPPGGQQPAWGDPGQSPPYGGQPTAAYGVAGYGEQQPGYAYNPYGSPYPGEPTAPAPSRPGLLVLALIMQILVSLPFLFLGVAVLVVPLNSAALPPEILDSPQLASAGATPELLVSLIRTVGVVFLVAALVYLLFAVLAFAGRNWSRIIVTILSVGFVLLLLAGLVNTGAGPDNLLIIGVPAVLLIGSVVLYFLPASNAWYTHRR